MPEPSTYAPTRGYLAILIRCLRWRRAAHRMNALGLVVLDRAIVAAYCELHGLGFGAEAAALIRTQGRRA